jgi:hypothetical protein
MKLAERKSWNALFDGNEGNWGLFLLFFAIAAHAYSIVVTGAKFWIDSVVYSQLALALFDAGQLGRLYNSEFGFLYQHTSPVSRSQSAGWMAFSGSSFGRRWRSSARPSADPDHHRRRDESNG